MPSLTFSLRIGAALGGVFLGLVLLVEALGYVTWHLTPRDSESMRQAAEFEAAMGRLVRSPNEGEVPVTGLEVETSEAIEVPDRFPTKAKAVHRVEEWPPERGRDFQEAPMLRARVRAGELPPVAERLPVDPLVIVPPHQIGPYGGTWARYGTGPRDIGITEHRFAYDGLVRWGPMGKKVLPNLAVRWEIGEGGRTYTFWLRKEVRWSDGHPFTVDDLLFWYENVLINKELTPVAHRDFVRGGEVVRVEKVDAYTVRFRFKRPNGTFLLGMASGRGYEMLRYPAHYMKQFHPRYVPQEDLEGMAEEVGFDLWIQLFQDKWDWRNPELPRLWPWVVVQPPPARPVVFMRNPFYWKVDPEGNQLPYMDRMTFRIFDRETINLKAINGEIGMQGRHMMFENYPLFMENQKRGGYRVLHWIGGSVGGVALNLNHKDPVLREIFGDRRFRIALSHAIDRDELIEMAGFGIGQKRQPAPLPTSAFYSEAFEKAHLDYDLDLANRMLDEVGLVERNDEGVRLRPDGKPLKLAIETNAINNRVLALVASYWTAVGVKTEIKEEARQLLYERKRALMHDAVPAGGEAQIPILEPRVFIPYSDESNHAIAYARWYRTDGKQGEEPPADLRRCIEVFRQIEETPDPAEQVRLFQEINELNRKNLWLIGTLAGTPVIMLVKDTFRNVPEVAMGAWSGRAPGSTAIECYAIEEN